MLEENLYAVPRKFLTCLQFMGNVLEIYGEQVGKLSQS